jgi:TolB-like protein/Flp pilus assembly protein TadD
MRESGGSPITQLQRPPAPDAAADAGSFPDVFVSYASRDVAVADAVVATLERQGLRCWIAPRDVPPGGLYADGIISAINGTKVLVLVLSENAVSSSHVGKEIERASSKQRPVVALRTDTTPLTPAFEYFLSESQWIDVGAGGVDGISAKLVEAVQRLISHPSGVNPTHAAKPTAVAIDSRAIRRLNRPLVALIATIVAALAYFVTDKLWLSKHATTVAAPAMPGTVTAVFSPPAHSIAVLPFVNMSGDPKQDYFSDGLTEELLNALANIRNLQVAARTSSFAFKGTNADTATIAHKLNVGAILEGSVRKEGDHVRISAQFINAVTGFQLWSKTYDRNLKDILSLETEIATAVSSALEAKLLAQPDGSPEPGGTDNPEAYDAYLRGEKLIHGSYDRMTNADALAAFNEAIRRDPHFANAYLGKARTLHNYAGMGMGEDVRRAAADARAAAETAIAIAPNLGFAHTVLAAVLGSALLDYRAAAPEFERGLALSPGDARVVSASASFLALVGRSEEAIALARKAVVLDPLNPRSHYALAEALYYARRYREAVESWTRSLDLDAGQRLVAGYRGYSYIGLGDYETARQSCDVPAPEYSNFVCLAVADDKLGRRADADAVIAELQKTSGEGASYQFAEIYAQRGDLRRALDWLDTAYRVGDTGLHYMKVDPLVDPLRSEPRFRAMLAMVKFPD